MSALLEQIQSLIRSGRVLISVHGYDELTDDEIFVDDALSGIYTARVVEEYPDYIKGPCLLVLQKDVNGRPIHVVWGIPRNTSEPAVLVTAYRPDSNLWNHDFTERAP